MIGSARLTRLARTKPTAIDALPPDLRAVLSLVLANGRGYGDIAQLLDIDRSAVRARAHIAADHLATNGSEPPRAENRSRIVDYLLGEQSVSERSETRGLLAGSPTERAWAARLAEALAPLAKEPVPAIPNVETLVVGAAVGAGSRAGAGGAAGGEPRASATVGAPVRRPPMLPIHVSGRRRRRHLRSWRIPASLAVAIAAVVVAIAIMTGGSSQKRQPAPSGPATADSQTGAAIAAAAVPSQPTSGQTLRQVVLAPTAANPGAVAVATILRQRGGLILALHAQGLTPNSGDAYAVWLENSTADARLLGFVSPLVGRDGTFSSGIRLPNDAHHFHQLLVTRETDTRPARPGQAVLRGTLP
jgi:hypothetical protein